jgi:hypothetical protein
MIDSVAPPDRTPGDADEESTGWRPRLRRSVFPELAAERPTTRKVVLAVAAVIAGTAVALARTKGHGAFDSMWAEDGSEFYSVALNGHLWNNVFRGINGYFVVLCRLIAEVAAAAPIGWGPFMMSTGAALVTAVFALSVYVASRAHLRSAPLRLLVAVPVVACPTGTLSTVNNVATLQFVALYATFWMLLWTPTSRFGRAFALSLVVLTGLSTILTVVLLPLVLLRLYVARNAWSLALIAALIGSMAVQVGGLVFDINSRSGVSDPRLDPVWAVVQYFRWAVPYSIIGERWMAPAANHNNGLWDVQPTQNPYVHAGLIALAYLVVVVAVVLAVRRFTRPAWGLVAVAGVQSVIVLAVEVMSYGHAYGPVGYLMAEMALLGTIRYLVPVTLLIIVTVTALLVPRPVEATGGPATQGATGRRPNRSRLLATAPVLTYAALLLLVILVNLRPTNPRTMVPSWDAEVAKAREHCRATNAVTAQVHNGGDVWWPWVSVPCRRLR